MVAIVCGASTQQAKHILTQLSNILILHLLKHSGKAVCHPDQTNLLEELAITTPHGSRRYAWLHVNSQLKTLCRTNTSADRTSTSACRTNGSADRTSTSAGRTNASTEKISQVGGIH